MEESETKSLPLILMLALGLLGRLLGLLGWLSHGLIFLIINDQRHFFITMFGPTSAYSALEIHYFWKVESWATMAPPSHGLILRVSEANTRGLPPSAEYSSVNRSGKPRRRVLPPVKWILDLSALVYVISAAFIV